MIRQEDSTIIAAMIKLNYLSYLVIILILLSFISAKIFHSREISRILLYTGGALGFIYIIFLLIKTVQELFNYIVSFIVRAGKKQVNLDDWILESVKYFRSLGFFEQLKNLTDQQLARKIKSRILKEDASFDPKGEFSDIYLLEWDNKRVWFQDLEADVDEYNKVYTKTLKRWAEISRGAFTPKDIKETWKTESGPIYVDFVLNGKKQQLKPKDLGDWFDISILNQINRVIKNTGYQFEMYAGYDLAFVLVLKPEEKRKLQFQRGWEFEREFR